MMELIDEPDSPRKDLLSMNDDHKTRNNYLEIVGDLLEKADIFLEELDSNQLLGPAILRRCNELANALGDFSQDLEKANEERTKMVDSAEKVDGNKNEGGSSMIRRDMGNHVQVMTALPQVLRDIEESFRSIKSNEADEIADVAISVGRILVLSMKQFYTATHAKQQRENEDFSSRIELLEEEEESLIPRDITTEKKRKIDGITATPNIRKRKPANDRIRPLWPPIGPSALKIAEVGKQEALNNPLLAVIVGLLLWPMVLFTAFAIFPIFIADYILQGVYNACKESPLIITMERTTAQIVQTSRLSFLCSSLALRQTARVTSRQVDRNGGWVSLSQKLCDTAIDRALHPVETLSIALNGFFMATQWIQQAFKFAKDTWEREQAKTLAEKMND